MKSKNRKTKEGGLFIAATFILFLLFSCNTTPEAQSELKYEPSWESLKQHETPQWLRDGKFGIYTHFGVYCYTATHGNATWNSFQAYRNPDSRSRIEFTRKFGELSPDFGYKALFRNSLLKISMRMNGLIFFSVQEQNLQGQ
jgi:hypothetical protein